MEIKEVSDIKFNALIDKSIKLKPCKCGSPGVNIIIDMPTYFGKVGAYVMCPKCNNKTASYNISTMITYGDKIGTPTIERSLMSGIRSAINEWNNKKIKGDNK